MKFKYCLQEVKLPLDTIPSESFSLSSDYMELEDLMNCILLLAHKKNSSICRFITDSFKKGREILEAHNIDSTDYNVPNSAANVALCDLITEFIAKEIFSTDCLYIDELWGVELDKPLSEIIKYADSICEENEDLAVFIRTIVSLIGQLLFSTIDKLISDVLYKKNSKIIYDKFNEMVSKKEESVQETDNFS